MKKISKVFCILLLFGLFINAENPVSLYKMGKTAYFEEKYEEAIYYLKKALDINPNYLDALVELGHIYYDMEQYQYAYQYIKDVLKLSGDKEEHVIFSADIDVKLKKYKQGEEKYQKIIHNNPLNLDAYNGLANLYLETDRKIMAIKTLKDILTKQPENFKALYLSAQYYEEADTKKAEDYYLKNIHYNSLNPDAYFYYSVFLFQQDQIPKAIDHIKTAIDIKDNSKYQTYYGKYLLHLDEGDKALAIFEKMIRKKPANFLDFFHLANANILISQYDRALTFLQKAMNLRDDDEVSFLVYDKILLDHYPVDHDKRKKRARQYYLQAMNYKKDALFDLYLFYLKQAIRIYPKNTDARLELAQYFKANNFPERYIRELKIIKQYTDDIDVKDRIEIEELKILNKLGDSWKVSQYTVTSDIYEIPLFVRKNIENSHFNFETIYADYFKTISFDQKRFVIADYSDQEYSEFKQMQIAKQHFSPLYLLLEVQEDHNSLDIELKLINAYNNQELKVYSSYQVGNNRIIKSISSLLRNVDQDIPFRAHILKISGNMALINSGRRGGIQLKDKFLILKNTTYSLEDSRINWLFEDSDIKGTAIVVKVDENIAQIRFKDKDFFKDIDIDDVIIYYPE
ncbi:MAG: tetratricopeptide repeat protein [Spirochaetes bacterium]|nr:tetratricopeptide repeat protein [Spirochaetota bacterium]